MGKFRHSSPVNGRRPSPARTQLQLTLVCHSLNYLPSHVPVKTQDHVVQANDSSAPALSPAKRIGNREAVGAPSLPNGPDGLLVVASAASGATAACSTRA